jgi:phosphatidylglycerol---prolipoprotein diacylglyceryl transferase
MHPELFTVGTFILGTYGVFLTLGFLVPLVLVRWVAAKRGVSVAAVTDIAVLGQTGGFLGAKLLGVLVAAAQGGTEGMWSRGAGAIHGGLAGCILVFAWRLRVNRLDFATLAPVFPPAIALGQAIGRLGCFGAGCCYGKPGGPFPVVFTSEIAARRSGTPLGVPLHAVQLYDAAGHFALAALLLWLALRVRPGQGPRVFGLWLVLEGCLRITLETWRGDLDRGVVFGIPWLSTGRATSMVLIAVGIAVAWFGARRAEPSTLPPHTARGLRGATSARLEGRVGAWAWGQIAWTSAGLRR